MIISAVKAQQAADVLGVGLPGLTPDAVRVAYRSKAKECHPDHHQDKVQQWAEVSWAKEALEHWLRHHPAEEEQSAELAKVGDCRACGGTGRVKVGKGSFGQPLTMHCVMCNGLGSLVEKEKPGD
jgi:DnaJ-class molecular chaperone